MSSDGKYPYIALTTGANVMGRFISLLMLDLLLVLCAAGQRPDRAGGSEQSHLLAADSLFDVFSGAHGVAAAFLAFMADDALLFPSNDFPVAGREGIGHEMGKFPPGATLRWKPLRAEVAQSGELGFTYGTAEYRSVDSTGTPTSVYTKYVTVWKKQADGSWKFILDIGNRSPGPWER